MLAMKPIVYRGGVIEFQIPANWREEYEPDGGGTFYAEGANSTLRLNIMTLQSKQDIAADSAVRAVTRANGNRQVRQLPNGNAIARYVTTATERGVEIQLHTWELAGPLPPRHLRMAIFAHTILASDAGAPETIAELQMVDQIVTNAEFVKVRGVAKENRPKKPWWKR